MSEIVIQKLSHSAFERISELAARHRKSIEDEIVDLLETAVGASDVRDERVRLADRIAAMTPKDVVQTDSTLLIREDRDR